jgi:EAL domain-containing protein (putative c-di-GMP-specific phosphodiesterase class I)
VEIQQELSHLKALGVDYVQGYLLARPGPLDEIIGMRTSAEADLANKAA